MTGSAAELAVELGATMLREYDVAEGDEVAVFLLVTSTVDGDTAPEVYVGTVLRGTTVALLLAGSAGKVRVPWAAIAAIEDAPPKHPGLE